MYSWDERQRRTAPGATADTCTTTTSPGTAKPWPTTSAPGHACSCSPIDFTA
jgi:hypothetical protein